jgi:hypothetical protein
VVAAAQLVDGCEARLGRITSVRDAAEVVFDGQHVAGEPRREHANGQMLSPCSYIRQRRS